MRDAAMRPAAAAEAGALPPAPRGPGLQVSWEDLADERAREEALYQLLEEIQRNTSDDEGHHRDLF